MVAPPAVLAALALVVVAATVWDVRQRRIPNGLVLLGLLAGLGLGAVGGGLVGLGAALAGAGVAFLVLIFPFSRGWLGGGDVKLVMACGSLLGWQGALLTAVLGAALHGFVAVGAYAWARQRGAALPTRLPHAPTLALAALAYALGLLPRFWA